MHHRTNAHCLLKKVSENMEKLCRRLSKGLILCNTLWRWGGGGGRGKGEGKILKRGKISHLFGLKSPRWEEDLIMIELHNIYPWVIGPDPDY